MMRASRWPRWEDLPNLNIVSSRKRRMIMVGNGMVAPLRLVKDADQTIDLDLD